MGLWAFPFDLATLTRTGEIFKVTDKASFGFAVSAQNTLIYHFKKPIPTFRLRWIQDDGTPGSYLEGTLDRQWTVADISQTKSTSSLVPTKIYLRISGNVLVRSARNPIVSKHELAGIASLAQSKANCLPAGTIKGCGHFQLNRLHDKQTLLPRAMSGRSNPDATWVQSYPRWGRHAFIDMERGSVAQPFHLI